MSLKAQHAAALEAAQNIVDAIKADGRTTLNADEQAQVKAKLDEADEIAGKIKAAKEADDLMARLGSYAGPGDGDREKAEAAKSLGEHFVKTVGAEGLSRVKTISGTTVAAPAWSPDGVKVATDTHVIPGAAAPWLTTYDRTVVRAFRRPVVSDVLGTGTLGAGSNAVSYFVEGAVEGAFATVAESGQKPQLHIADPTTRTDALKKIAGVLSFTDEMAEDMEFWVSEINQRGLYLLALAEEDQLLNGDGTGNNVLGIRNRSGIQTETSASAADNPDALYRALTKVQTATGLTADAIIVNPTDYQNLRLRRDANGQYYGGGYFEGEYGNGDMDWQPPVWGVRTVVSPAVAAGTPLVGAFQVATTVYRKGGVRVESTNSHDTDFDFNRIRTRIEERVALAVRVPSAIVAVTLSNV